MNAQSLFQLLLSGEQWGHAKVFNVNELLWLMMMTQNLGYGQLTTFTTSLLTCPTSQTDILPSFVPPPAQTDILPIFGNLFVLPRHSLTYCPALACNLFSLAFSCVQQEIHCQQNQWLKFKQRHFSNMCHQTLTPPPAMSVIHLKMDRLWPSWIEIWSTAG